MAKKTLPRKILVIEDDPGAARLIGYTLERQGYQVLAAANGPAGLRRAQEEAPDLVVLDIMLPGLDGFQLCRRLRTESQTSHIPIMILSGKTQESDKATGLRLGADEYITKPHDPSELVRRMESLLAKKAVGHAKTIAFLGCRGGVGTSTVAANVAVVLAEKNKRVTLVDLCPYCGMVAAFLGLKPEHTIAELLQQSPGTVNRQELQAVMTPHATGLMVLASPQTADRYQELPPSAICQLFQELRSMADYVVSDAPQSDAAKAILKHCEVVVLVTGAESGALNNVSSTAALLQKNGIDGGRLAAVVVDREGLVSHMDFARVTPIIESATKIRLMGIIPHDSQVPIEFEARGTPVALADPRRPVSLALRQLAERIATFEVQAPEAEGGAGGGVPWPK